ncbi:uncharacterized protein LOC142000234 [Natator depressus]|uniref:uncharacterized protein LOC142000234 n=1 Tax=Natator depressus TaxID=27790 RepID=UPI003EB93042
MQVPIRRSSPRGRYWVSRPAASSACLLEEQTKKRQSNKNTSFKAREEREMFQRQHMERLKQEERLKRFRGEEQKRQQEGRLLQLLEETKGTYEAQRIYLEEQLSQEKQLCYEIQRKAEAQISGLQAEIKRLMEKRLSIDTYSEGSLTAPAPSLQSLTPSQTLHPQPSPVQTPPPTVTDGTNRTREIHGKTAKTITLDLLEQLMQAANTTMQLSRTL